MPKTRVPLRLDSELSVWADAYAKRKGVTRTAIYERALRELRESVRGERPHGAEPFPERARSEQAPGGGGVRAPVPRVSSPAPAEDLRARYAAERQQRLNADKVRATRRSGNG